MGSIAWTEWGLFFPLILVATNLHMQQNQTKKTARLWHTIITIPYAALQCAVKQRKKGLCPHIVLGSMVAL